MADRLHATLRRNTASRYVLPARARLGTMGGVLFVAANHGHQDNTRRLLASFGRHMPAIALDSGSALAPEDRQLFAVAMPNVFYSGLLNQAVQEARQRAAELLFFCCSDVVVGEPDRVVAAARRAFEDSRTGVWAPAATGNASWHQCRPRRFGRRGPRQVAFVEGYCFVARLALLEQMTPVDTTCNAYGWGLDVHLGYTALANGLRTLVDDSVRVHHPRGTGYAIEAARKQRNDWYQTLPPAARHFRAVFGLRPAHWPPCFFWLKRGWSLR